MASSDMGTHESNEAVLRELQSELDAGHISERQHAAAVKTVEALAETRSSLQNAQVSRIL